MSCVDGPIPLSRPIPIFSWGDNISKVDTIFMADTISEEDSCTSSFMMNI